MVGSDSTVNYGNVIIMTTSSETQQIIDEYQDISLIIQQRGRKMNLMIRKKNEIKFIVLTEK